MIETNKVKVVGLFGFIGSGKSYIINSLKGLERLSPISKEEAGVLWYGIAYGTNDLTGYENVIYKEFKKDLLFLVKESSKSFNKNKINVLDSVNTPIEDSYLRENYEYLLIGIWRRKQERKESILKGREKLVKISEPRDESSFLTLNKLVKGYMHEEGCLFCNADELIINKREENLIEDFIEAINRKWK